MRLSEHCYAVTGLAYTAPWSLNAGFIVGSETTLVIDTAATALSAATIHGYATAVRPANRIAVINTERHFDHIGGNGYFRDKGAAIYGHSALRRTEDEFRAEVEEFNQQIPNPIRRSRTEARVFYTGTALAFPDRPIASDTSLDLGDCRVEILLTPGHTETNLCVYLAQDGVLFSGDCVVTGYMPNLECGTVQDWQQWLASLDRVESLAPKILVPGHGPVAKGEAVREAIRTIRLSLQEAIKTGSAPTAPRAN